mmetsp:Transcript_28096/g.71108  ORF Transcript_28096/g.71108 Transcript_28096/m.71108 type:complete len:139 (+) Transcript_28096:307-723(+)
MALVLRTGDGTRCTTAGEGVQELVARCGERPRDRHCCGCCTCMCTVGAATSLGNAGVGAGVPTVGVLQVPGNGPNHVAVSRVGEAPRDGVRRRLLPGGAAMERGMDTEVGLCVASMLTLWRMLPMLRLRLWGKSASST